MQKSLKQVYVRLSKGPYSHENNYRKNVDCQVNIPFVCSIFDMGSHSSVSEIDLWLAIVESHSQLYSFGVTKASQAIVRKNAKSQTSVCSAK